MRRWFLASLCVLATIALVGCGNATGAGSEQVSVSRDGPWVVLTSSAPGRSDISTKFIATGTPAVHCSSFEWPAQGVADMYIYGLAPAGATSFATSPSGTARIQADGGFYSVIPGAATSPVQGIHWSFMAGDGTILAEGDGPNT